MRLALFQPDIPQNTGTIMRLCACFNVPLDIIEPCGFVMNDKKMRRAGMDYLSQLDMTRHQDWENFYRCAENNKQRIILMTTKSSQNYTGFNFQKTDILLAGRESGGVPDHVHNQADAAVAIPMTSLARSLNVALSCSIILAEALRQGRISPRRILQNLIKRSSHRNREKLR